jgi:hypothetical protein
MKDMTEMSLDLSPYAGKWIAIYNDQIIASNEDPLIVAQFVTDLRKKQSSYSKIHKNIQVFRVAKPDEPEFEGAWPS